LKNGTGSRTSAKKLEDFESGERACPIFQRVFSQISNAHLGKFTASNLEKTPQKPFTDARKIRPESRRHNGASTKKRK
jgi:hypothetical protein